MKVTVNKAREEVHVQYALNHIAHKNKLGHLRISEQLRQTIAGKLAYKVCVDSILDDIRDNSGDMLQSDLIQKNSDDAKSVHCWVADLAEAEIQSSSQ